MRRLSIAVLTLVALGFVVLASRSSAQVPPLPIPLTTTTTQAPPPTTTTPPATTAPASVVTGAPTDTSVPDTVPAIAETPLPLETTPAAQPSTVTTAAARPRTVALAGLRPAAVTGAYGIGLGGVLAVALLLVTFTTLARSQLQPGGSPMTARRRARLIAGIACLALAAIVGLVGYLKLSLEPDVNRQIPYLASAGMALVLLSAVGGALLVGEQMRTDEQRIEELEAAVQHLASMVAPTVEAPARTRRRSSASR